MIINLKFLNLQINWGQMKISTGEFFCHGAPRFQFEEGFFDGLPAF
jgi:hypothetical protein